MRCLRGMQVSRCSRQVTPRAWSSRERSGLKASRIMEALADGEVTRGECVEREEARAQRNKHT